MGRHKGTFSAEHKEIMRQKAKREWIDPITRAERMAAMRRFDHEAILTAIKERPKRPYKAIAHDFQVSPAYVSHLAVGYGIRRNAFHTPKSKAGKAQRDAANDQQQQDTA